jgi:hypothetical protein
MIHNPRDGESGSSRSKEFRTQKSSSKMITSVFWNKDGALLVDYVERGATMIVKYYVALLEKTEV